jgi:hypothetical protein
VFNLVSVVVGSEHGGQGISVAFPDDRSEWVKTAILMLTDSWPGSDLTRWAAWSSMPHCCLWQPSDWQFALDTLEIAARFYDYAAVSWSTELRYREKVMGTT